MTNRALIMMWQTNSASPLRGHVEELVRYANSYRPCYVSDVTCVHAPYSLVYLTLIGCNR